MYPGMMRDAVFNVKEWSGYVSVKKTGSFGKSKIDKYVLNNLRLKIETSLTFSSLLGSPSISWPPGVGVSGGSDTGTLSFDAEHGPGNQGLRRLSGHESVVDALAVATFVTVHRAPA
ncbi:hypothetical protein E1295_28480 [Nonomuraea mesophila]|uniref:Uncharacterized protein n=1 Tax=Nonomuraea mesophila TaxID=2530382 RepID=A0A4R5F3P2_9ACTN|nr:hypothetical protein [Nonomuraea mesophila]TDE42056.1 hypothetical protein E1295_28480 [Nonomuraea mesophila]